MRRTLLILIAVLSVLFIAGCGANADTGEIAPDSSSVQVDGSGVVIREGIIDVLLDSLFYETQVRMGMSAEDYPVEASEPDTYLTEDLCRYLYTVDDIAADGADLWFWEDGGLSFVVLYNSALYKEDLILTCGEPDLHAEDESGEVCYWVIDDDLVIYNVTDGRLQLFTKACAETLCPAVLMSVETGMRLYDAGFEGLYWYRDSASLKYGLYDIDEDSMLTDACYEEYGTFSPEGMVPVKQDGYWGYINGSGETIIGHYFENAYPFIGDNAVVGSTGAWGAIDCLGNYVVRPEYLEVEIDQNSNYILVRNKADNWGVYDRFGNMLIKASTSIKDEDYKAIKIHNGLLYAQTSDRWYHVYDETGEQLLSNAHAIAFPKNGFHIVWYEHLRYTFADEALNVIGEKTYDALCDFSASGYAVGFIANSSGRGGRETWEIIDSQGNVVHTLYELNNGDGNTTYEYANSYLVYGYYAMGTGQSSVKYGVVDLRSGEFTQYAAVKPVNKTECMIVTDDSGLLGLYDRDELVYDCVYDEISFDGEIFHLTRGVEESIYTPSK